MELTYSFHNNNTTYTVTNFTPSNTTSETLSIDNTYNGKPVTKIGNGAFANTSLKSITIPDSITYIDQYPFQNTNSLTTINISPNSKLLSFHLRMVL
jgi:hypothetical protein